MKKQYIAIVVLWFAGGIIVAQNERDAFRYAQYSPTGTARYSALSGSMGAFGADFTTLSANNPAGIGLFKRSEMALTPTVPYYKITSAYNGEIQAGTKLGFNLNHLGFVFAFSAPSNTNWKRLQFATGYNNLARYSGHSIARGLNIGELYGTTNFFDCVAETPNREKNELLQDITDVAYKYNLIDSVSGISMISDFLNQQQIKTSNGYLNEWVFSFGGNYDDKLFVGATIGIPFFYYNQKTTYTEEIETVNGTFGYDNFKLYDEFTSQSTGINFKLGVIYQPAKFIRVGAAFHTPTAYLNVEEKYQSEYELLNVYNPLDSGYYNVSWESTIGRFNYQLTTPFRAMANVVFLIKKDGFVNIDYEFTDYSLSNLQSNTYNFNNNVNKNIKDYYRGTHTFRLGGELNLSPVTLRLGYAYSTNPYTKSADIDGSRHSISGGVGFKAKSFFADFAYMYRFTNDKDVFYDATSIYPYKSTIVNQVFALTFGWKLGK